MPVFILRRDIARKKEEVTKLNSLMCGYEKLSKTVEELLRKYKPGKSLFFIQSKRLAQIFDSFSENVQNVMIKTKETGLGDKIILTTYWSSKGLEAKEVLQMSTESLGFLL